jgi:hypothetical protein
MERFMTTNGLFGRTLGRPVACLRKRDIAPGAHGRSLPFGWET